MKAKMSSQTILIQEGDSAKAVKTLFDLALTDLERRGQAIWPMLQIQTGVLDGGFGTQIVFSVPVAVK